MYVRITQYWFIAPQSLPLRFYLCPRVIFFSNNFQELSNIDHLDKLAFKATNQEPAWKMSMFDGIIINIDWSQQ